VNGIDGATYTDTHIFYEFSFDLRKIEKAKQIGMVFSKAKKRWYLSRNMMNERLFEIQFSKDPVVQVRHHVMLEAAGHYKPNPLLMEHQRRAVELAMNTDRHLFAYDTGVGKTFIGIEIIKFKAVKTLVVCPLSIITPAWFEDLDKFAPEIRKANLWKQKRRQLRFYRQEMMKSQVCIVNFEAFKSQLQYIEEGGFKMVLIDESSKIKNYKSQITKDITKYCDNIEFVYLFSGTPAPNSELEYFPQTRIINPLIHGKSYFRHRNKFFVNPGLGFKWFLSGDRRIEFLDGLSKVMTVVKKEDVLDLPPRTFNKREVILSPKEKKAYKEMATQLVAEIEDEEITAYNAAVKIMKLRQVTAGFMFNEDGVPMFLGTSKLKELLSLLEEIGANQVIIWTQFQYEAFQIMDALAPHQRMALKRGFKDYEQSLHENPVCGLCNGTVSQDLKDLQVRLFKEGKFQYMIAHPKSLGHGVTLTNTSYAIYNSLSYSSEEHKQSQDRIYRKGQYNACTYYYLLAPGTIDPVIYSALRGKTKMENAVLSYIKGAHSAKLKWAGI